MKILKKIILITLFISFYFINIINATSQEILEDNPNLNLENLAVENILLYPPFDAYTLNYDIEVPNDINDLNILAVPQNEQSKVTITGDTNLKEGQNKIAVTVTSINGKIRKYIINAYQRSAAEEELYIQNKEEQQLQLQSLYETQKLTSNDIDNGYKVEKTYRGNNTHGENSKKYISIIVITIVIILAFLLIIKNKNKKQE